MARADSTIRVLILGDAKGLQGELKKADKGIKGFAGSLKGIAAIGAGAIAAGELVDFAQTALNEADRLGDATARLEIQLGDLADPLVDNADKFAHLGQSAQDILELEAAFADTATALSITDPLIGSFADDVAATAAAVALMGDMDAATVVELIGKAAGGSEKALKALGIDLSDAEVEARALRDTGKGTAEALTDGEKAAAAMAIILEKLSPKLDAAAEGSGDLEQSQSELQAKFETLTGKIGAALEGPLNALLTWILNGIEGWEMLIDVLPGVGRALEKFLEPVADAIDALRDVYGVLEDIFSFDLSGIGDAIGGAVGAVTGSHGAVPVGAPASVNINVNGGDPAEVERQVKKAMSGYVDRNGSMLDLVLN